MLSVLKSRAMLGMEAPLVTVEVHLANGLPSFNIVGLPEMEVKESKDRVRAALINSNFEFPAKRITVNLAPADLPKASGRFDLAIALGIVIASEQARVKNIDEYEFAGELSLSGELRSIKGALSMAYGMMKSHALLSPDVQAPILVLPKVSASEASLIQGVKVLGVTSLSEVCHLLQNQEQQELWTRPEVNENTGGCAGVSGVIVDGVKQVLDWSDVKGQQSVKYALEIAASGGHSVLMVGPPGTGKSMLAQRMASIMPPLTEKEAMESAAILSSVGYFEVSQWRQRVFRSPHHTASSTAIVGGGSNPRPGEISLAHHGVLFLDELPEFDKKVLEVMREPLETGEIHISRAARQTTFLARFQLVAAMNPCPCGYTGHKSRPCRCNPAQVKSYQSKLSGPFLNRIDIQVEVPSISVQEVENAPKSKENSQAVLARILNIYHRQINRQGCLNAHLNLQGMEAYCEIGADAKALLAQAMEQFNWSARVYHRVLRVARTIADHSQHDDIQKIDVVRAIQLRRVILAHTG